MPRSVLAAVLGAGALALAAAADLVSRAIAHLAPRLEPVRLLDMPTTLDVWWILGAALLAVGSRRRTARVRLPIFWFALGMAVLLGTIAAPLVTVAALTGRAPLPALALTLAVVVPHAVVAYGLSRPSAKAWFTPAHAP